MERPTGVDVTDEQRYAWIKQVVQGLPNNQWFSFDEVSEKCGYPRSMVGPFIRKMEARQTGDEQRQILISKDDKRMQWDTEE